MALIPCPECKRMVSETAKTCPKCGHNLTEEEIKSERQKIEEQKTKNVKACKNILIITGIVLLIIFFASTFSSGKNTQKSQKTSIYAIADIIESAITAFDEHEINVDEENNIIHLSILSNGLASSVSTIKSIGSDEANELWEKTKDSFIKINNEMANLCKEHGREDISVSLLVLNDENPDNTLLTILNGIVIYDVVED